MQERKEVNAIPCICGLILLRMELPFSDAEYTVEEMGADWGSGSERDLLHKL